MSASRETSWALPLSICLELDADQQDFIRDLIYEYEQRSRRTARAKMNVGAENAGIASVPKETPADGGYIKPSPATTSNDPPPDRPVSLFPPESPGAPNTDRSSEARQSDNVEYMAMNGVRLV